MGDFSAEWLALREPADHRARSVRLTRELAARLLDRHPVRVVDLASGTGSNLRYLGRFLPPRQHWRLVDRDGSLLAHLEKKSVPSVASVLLQPRDLSAPDALIGLFHEASLVTASALLDLVSARWLEGLVDRCVEASAAALFALTYDGRIHCTPADPDDGLVSEYVNRHQRTDKGFGPALGPAAAEHAARCFQERGFTIDREHSDWKLDGGEAALQRQLIDGWASAALEIAPASAETIAAWRSRRHAQVSAGRSTIVVGHEDLVAWIK